jgi:proteic killer suppression protein
MRLVPVSDGDGRAYRVDWLGASPYQDLRVPPSNHFEKLRGNLAGFYSIRVNSQWLLIFRWDGSRGEAQGIYLDDHSYR